MKSFVLALNAASALAAVTFPAGDKNVALDEVVYDTVYSQMTFDDNTYSLTANWGSAELKQGDASAYILAMGLEVGAVDLASGTAITTTVSIEDPHEPGMLETWTCSTTYMQPERKDETGGKTGSPKTYARQYTIGNSYGNASSSNTSTATWFGDKTDPSVSYASYYTWSKLEGDELEAYLDPESVAAPAETTEEPAATTEEPAATTEEPVESTPGDEDTDEAADTETDEDKEETDGEEEEPEPPAKNSFQMCSAARVVSSDIPDITAFEATEGVNMRMKVNKTFKVQNSFTVGGSPAMTGSVLDIMVAESGAISNLFAAATALIALYAF